MKSVRITVSLPEEQHEQLQNLAEKNSLSVAWLVRQAVGDFLEKIDDPQNYNPLTKESTQGDS